MWRAKVKELYQKLLYWVSRRHRVRRDIESFMGNFLGLEKISGSRQIPMKIKMALNQEKEPDLDAVSQDQYCVKIK